MLLADRASLAKTASIHSLTPVTALLNNLLMFQGNPRVQIYDNQAYVRPLINKYTAFRKTCIIASSVLFSFSQNSILLILLFFINIVLVYYLQAITTHILI